MSTGMIWLSTLRYTVGLDIVDGVVADAPPIARRVYELGRQSMPRRVDDALAHLDQIEQLIDDARSAITSWPPAV